MRLMRTCFAAAIFLASASITFAQSAPPPPPPAPPISSSQSAVRVTTRIVQVSVTVHDDRGRPVAGLTKDDFVLLDEGKRQQITSITERDNRLTTTAALSRPNLFTNRFEQGAAAQPVLTVIVMDVYNARYWDAFPKKCGGHCPPICVVGYMFYEVEKFLTRMHPGDRVALYVLGADELHLVQDFASDPSALRRGLVRGKEYVPVVFPPSQVAPRDMDTHTMNAMQVISDRLVKIPGRKNLIWLSPGFPPDDSFSKAAVTTLEKMDKAAKLLGNADFPLFAIDGAGLTGGGGGGGAGGGGGGGGMVSGVDTPTPSSGGVSAECRVEGRPPKLTDFDYSKSLAELSGGRAYENTNDFAGAIRKVIDDSASSYILNYYPDHNKWNGEFREIKVKVNRSGLSGLEVRARKGYFAVTDTTTAQQRDAQKLIDAVRSPLESTDLGFDVQADGFDVAGVRQLKVKISLDANQLRFRQENGWRSDSLTETWAEFNAEGQQVGQISKTIDLTRTESAYKQLLQNGFTYSKTLVLAKDAAEVRLILSDAGNGAIGSVIIPLARLFATPPTAQ